MRSWPFPAAALVDPRLPDDAAGLDAALTGYAETIGAARPLVGERQAAVQVVDEAGRRAEKADSERSFAEDEAARLEAMAEADRARLAESGRAARIAQESFVTRLAAWHADDRGVPFGIPGELTAETIENDFCPWNTGQ